MGRIKRVLVGIGLAAMLPLASGCLLDEAGRAVEDVGDEIEDAGEAIEDGIDDDD
jgi:hypothetical protein